MKFQAIINESIFELIMGHSPFEPHKDINEFDTIAEAPEMKLQAEINKDVYQTLKHGKKKPVPKDLKNKMQLFAQMTSKD
ncbi:MAG: hypothetical protein H0T62_04345 [Parachlamydiaceae bacterium]|nr:hypothetical protein [Parachlamydiaceae bacterium]